MNDPEVKALDYDFTEDFLYFFEGRTSEDRSDREAELIVRLVGHAPGKSLLDLACGSGRMANRLAARGGHVSGVDLSASFIARARQQARERRVVVDYILQDMREISWKNRFDSIVSWYSSFGYFDDSNNLDVLRRCHSALRPGGRLLMEVNNRDELLRNYLPSIVVRRGSDLLIDENSFNPITGRTTIRRTILRDGRFVQGDFSIRLFNFNELRDCFLQTGFVTVEIYAGDGGAFEARSQRMILIGYKAETGPVHGL